MASKQDRFGAIAERNRTLQIIKKFDLWKDATAKAIYEELIAKSVENVIEDRKSAFRELGGE